MIQNTKMAARFFLLCFLLFLAFETEGLPTLVCGKMDNCVCNRLNVTCNGLPDVAPRLRSNKTLTTMNWIPDNATELDLLKGYLGVTLMGNGELCTDHRLQNFSRPDCEPGTTTVTTTTTSESSKETIRITTTSTKISREGSASGSDSQDALQADIENAVRDQILGYVAAGLIWSAMVSVMYFILSHCLIHGLLHTYHRINKLHTIYSKRDIPCIVRYALWQRRLLYRFARTFCCCRECKTLSLPTLKGKNELLFIHRLNNRINKMYSSTIYFSMIYTMILIYFNEIYHQKTIFSKSKYIKFIFYVNLRLVLYYPARRRMGRKITTDQTDPNDVLSPSGEAAH